MPGAMNTAKQYQREQKNESCSVSQVWSVWGGGGRDRREPIASSFYSRPCRAVPGSSDFFLPPPLCGERLEAPAAPHGGAGRRQGGEEVQGRAFLPGCLPAHGLPWPRGGRVFHKYLQKGLKVCCLQLAIPHANLRTSLFPLTPRDRRPGPRQPLISRSTPLWRPRLEVKGKQP